MALTTVDSVNRYDIECFLYVEAALLDEWRLDEWLKLFTSDGSYYVPSTDDPDGDHRSSLFLIADDYERLAHRVEQLMGRFVHAETPHSRTRRSITNVRIRKASKTPEELHITANFIVNRIRLESVDTYVGRYEYRLQLGEGRVLIKERRAILDLDTLRPHGKVSFIL